MYINTRENLCSCPHYRWISVTPKKAQLHTTSLNNLHSNRQRGIAQVYIPTYIRTSRNSKRLPQRPINTSKPHRPARARASQQRRSPRSISYSLPIRACARESLSLSTDAYRILCAFRADGSGREGFRSLARECEILQAGVAQVTRDSAVMEIFAEGIISAAGRAGGGAACKSYSCGIWNVINIKSFCGRKSRVERVVHAVLSEGSIY